MVIIAPSILSADFSKLGQEIKDVENGGAKWIHIDVMDGHFVPNITIGPAVVQSIRKTTKLFFDCHLMVENPSDFIIPYAKAGADLITIHIESNSDIKPVIKKIKENNCLVGVSLNPDTSLNGLTDLINDIDLILIMSVFPGFSGQSFISDVVPKIKAARNLIDESEKKIFLQVDGGINDKTAAIVKDNGADVLVAASFIFKNKNYKNAIQDLIQA